VLATTGPAGAPHAAPVWYLWNGDEIRISTPGTTQKVRDIERDPRVAFCVDDQVAGEYLTLYGEAAIVTGERVAELTWPLLLAYMHPAEAAARWERIARAWSSSCAGRVLPAASRSGEGVRHSRLARSGLRGGRAEDGGAAQHGGGQPEGRAVGGRVD